MISAAVTPRIDALQHFIIAYQFLFDCRFFTDNFSLETHIASSSIAIDFKSMFLFFLDGLIDLAGLYP
jgi:hypothetical protein